jgi:hypothetical protein
VASLMGLPVVTVASGGLPVVEATFGTPVTEASNGRGVPVTKVVGKPGLPVRFETIGVAAPFTGTTLNGTPTAGVTMSNGNLTATHTTTSASQGVLSTSAQTTGLYYFEIAVVTSTASSNYIGIVRNSAPDFSLTTWTTLCTSVVNGGSSIIYSNGASTAKDLGNTSIGDVFGFAINLTTRLAWVRRNAGLWNADALANPATGANGVIVLSGAFVPGVRFGNASGNAFTANFGASAFTGAVPADFTSGWPA